MNETAVEKTNSKSTIESIANCDLLATETNRISSIELKEIHQRLADEFYKKSLLKVGQFPQVEIASFNQWEIDPLKSRSWQLYFNWLSFLPIFLTDHHWSQSDMGLNVCKSAINGWIDHYQDTDDTYSYPFIWNDYGTAARAFQFAIFIHYVKNYASLWAEQNLELLEKIVSTLKKHGSLLAKESFYSKFNNHGQEQCRVLLLLGRYLDRSDWRGIAAQRLVEEFEFSFTEEGIHVENSPAYHVVVFNKFLSIVTYSTACDVPELVKKFRELSESMLRFLSGMIRPDLRLPIIGDTENLLVGDATELPVIDIYKNYFQGSAAHQYFTYILSRGESGKENHNSHWIYPKSGYAIFKDSTITKDSHENSFHLIVKAGALSSYHYQEDEGNVVFCAFGEDWLIDSGIYKYEPANPIRIYARSRLAHNVPLIDKSNYLGGYQQRLNKFKFIDHSIEESFPFVEFCVEVLQEVIHVRKVQWHSKQRKLIINDSFEMKDGASRDVILQWHFPIDKSIEILKNNQVSVTSAKQKTLLISVENGTVDEIELIKGIEGERMSIVSYRQGTYEDSQTIYFKFNKRESFSAETIMQFI